MPRKTYFHALFYSGAVFNALVAVAFGFAFSGFFRILGGGSLPETPLLQLFIELVALAIFCFGVLYFFAGRWLEAPESNLLIALGAVGKLAFLVWS